MKNLSRLFLGFAATAVLLSSCGTEDEEPVPPTLNITQDATTGIIGETITFSIQASSNEELKTITIDPSTDGANEGSTVNEEIAGGTYNYTSDYTYEIPSGLAAGTVVTIVFEVFDKNTSSTASKTITVDADETPLGAAITGKLYNADGPSGFNGAWSFATDESTPSAGDQDVQDMGLVSGDWSMSWKSETGATFAKVNSFDYDNATVESATAAFAGATAETGAITEGDIYIIKLASGKHIALKVTKVEVTADDNKDFIEFEYKKEA